MRPAPRGKCGKGCRVAEGGERMIEHIKAVAVYVEDQGQAL